jgi:hypothetical protein
MILNEIQHQIIAKASVQELIERLGLEVVDNGYKVRSSVSQRVQGWMDKAAAAGPRIISVENPEGDAFTEKAEWMENQKKVYGPGWCPF